MSKLEECKERRPSNWTADKYLGLVSLFTYRTGDQLEFACLDEMKARRSEFKITAILEIPA